MREIKFRAWIPEIKEMIDVWQIDFNIDQIIWMDGNEVSQANYFSGYKKDCELMQFTGLKDKNGKEIYEGDIVQGEGSEGIYYAPVIYESCKFTIDSFQAVQVKNEPDWKLEHDQVKTHGFIIHWRASGYHTLENGWKELEVIGNIYENPELLNKGE